LGGNGEKESNVADLPLIVFDVNETLLDLGTTPKADTPRLHLDVRFGPNPDINGLDMT
jgi:hypothetical protein